MAGSQPLLPDGSRGAGSVGCGISGTAAQGGWDTVGAHQGEGRGELMPAQAGSILRVLGDGTRFLSSRTGLVPRQRNQGKSHCIIFYFLGLTFPSPDALAEFPEGKCPIGAEHPRKAGKAWGHPSCTVLPWIYPRDACRKQLPEKLSSLCIPLPCSIPKITAGWDSNCAYHGKRASPGKTGWQKGPGSRE